MAHFDETLLDEFVDFFEWIYAVNIQQESRDELFDYVSRYWEDEDTSEQELVASATDQYSQVVQELRSVESSRQLLHKHFRREFRAAIARLDSEAPVTDRDNILRFLADVITRENPDAIDRLPAAGESASTSRAPDAGESFDAQQVAARAAAPSPQPLAAQPTSTHAVASGGLSQSPDDMQQVLVEAQRQAQLATLLSNLTTIRHETAMHTIQQIKY